MKNKRLKLAITITLCIVLLFTFNIIAVNRNKVRKKYSVLKCSTIVNNEANNIEPSKLSRKHVGWSSAFPPYSEEDLKKFNAYYKGTSPSDKNIYLTFDEGYENGYTSKILDVLKKNNVKAAFFVTYPYVKSDTDLVKRMVDEGHLVCNHTTHHKAMELFTNQSDFNKELITLEKEFQSVTGKPMPKYFRPPEGSFSELSLYYTSKLGYKTIFWHFAYSDWNPQRQINEEQAKKIIIKKTHGGDIVLLHAVSKTNANILDSVIKAWKDSGYTLEGLDKLS